MSQARAVFRACVCCPNQCRSAMDATDRQQIESATPSALSLIALAAIDGVLPHDGDLFAALGRSASAQACVALCPYGYDIPALVQELLQELLSLSTKKSPDG